MLPKAYEIDQTPFKMLAQLADQERESQRQFEAIRLKQEQNKMDLFGGTQKQILDMSSKLPYEMQRQFIAGAIPAVKSIFKSGGSLQGMQQAVFDELMNLQSEVGGINQWVTKSKETAKQLGEMGFSPLEVEAELNRNLYNIQTDPTTGQQIMGPPKKVSELGNFDEYVQKHITNRPGMFWDMKKGMDEITKYTNNVKGSVLKSSTTKDPTGTDKATADWQAEMFGWTKNVEGVDPVTGLPIVYTVLDTTPLTSKDGKPILDNKGNPVTAISEDAYNKFIFGNPVIKTTIEAGGQQLINDENRRKFGTIFPTKAQMDQGAINPDDEGNKIIYSRLFANSLPQLERFKINKDVKSSRVKDNPPPINIYNTQPEETKPVSIQDRVRQVVAGNPEFIKSDGDVTDWFSFPIYGDKENPRSPNKVIYDKASGNFKVILQSGSLQKKKERIIEYTPQQITDYAITKLPDMSYTIDPRKWRTFGQSKSNVKWD